jgi:hypothetical protein
MAIAAINRGESVCVYAGQLQSSTSRIALGLMNPLIGPQLRYIGAAQGESYNRIIQFYRELEGTLGGHFLEPYRLVRILHSETEYSMWVRSQNDPFVRSLMYPASATHDICKPGRIQFEMDSYRVDTNRLLNLAADYIQKKATWINEWVPYTAIIPQGNTIRIKGVQGQSLVFCEGHWGNRNPFFSQLVFKQAYGHILVVESDRPIPKRIIHNGHWLCPITDRMHMYGASVFWQKNESHNALGRLCHALTTHSVPRFRLQRVMMGIRSCLANRQPYAGWHPTYPNMGCINGLGGHGLFHAPRLVRQLMRGNAINHIGTV